MKQLPLKLEALTADRNREIVLSAHNKEAFTALVEFTSKPTSSPFLLLHGDAKVGKSALAHSVCFTQSSVHVALLDFSSLNDMQQLYQLAQQPAILILDDLENLTSEQEKILFHLFNILNEQTSLHTNQSIASVKSALTPTSQPRAAAKLLLISRAPAKYLSLSLEDLKSRLILVPDIKIYHPQDKNVLEQILFKLFTYNHLTVPPSLIKYIVLRAPRSIAYYDTLVSQLSELSMQQGIPIGFRLVRSLMQTSEPLTLKPH